MDIDVKVGFKIDDTVYKMDLKLPTSAINKDNPFRFQATMLPDVKPPETTSKEEILLDVYYADQDNYCVTVAPPKNLLSGLGDLVEQLDVSVGKGDKPKPKMLPNKISK